jgi:hypothetical protein
MKNMKLRGTYTETKQMIVTNSRNSGAGPYNERMRKMSDVSKAIMVAGSA